MKETKAARFETLAVHSGERRPGPEGSLVFPIYQGTVYTYEQGTDYHDLKYIRLNSTPSQCYLNDKLAALEGAEAGLATSSGMAAFTTALLSLLTKGDHFLASDCLYGGTHDFITQYAENYGLRCTSVDPRDPASWAAAARPETKLFLVETITNPTMRVPRLKEVSDFARRRGLITLIDNTFASPMNFRPLSAGFDLVFHSATKYLNGHSDLVAGCLMGRRELVEKVRRALNLYGGTIDPHATFLLARGIKTLALRMRAANTNGLTLARFFAGHPAVSHVNYAGLETHPDHQHAREMLSGFGGMLSVRLKGGVPAADRLLSSVRIPYVAPSLGGVETLITRPAVTSHAGMRPEDRARLGITDDLIRISCGIEHPDDLVEDFRQALAGAV